LLHAAFVFLISGEAAPDHAVRPRVTIPIFEPAEAPQVVVSTETVDNDFPVEIATVAMIKPSYETSASVTKTRVRKASHQPPAQFRDRIIYFDRSGSLVEDRGRAHVYRSDTAPSASAIAAGEARRSRSTFQKA